VYARSSLHASRWSPSVACLSALEIDWVRTRDNLVFVAAVYHPPRPTYKPDDLLSYIETSVAEISHDFPLAEIVLAGDLNQLDDKEVIERRPTGLTQVVNQPTCGANILDRVFVSNPAIYMCIRVVSSTVRSDHKAIVCFPDRDSSSGPKTRTLHTYRPHTPLSIPTFCKLPHALILVINIRRPVQNRLLTQAEFNHFYNTMHALLNEFFPLRTITLSSREPAYITLEIQNMLRRKNRLMRASRVEKAGALAVQIGKKISAQCRGLLQGINARTDAKALWSAVCHLTNRGKVEPAVDGITAESLL